MIKFSPNYYPKYLILAALFNPYVLKEKTCDNIKKVITVPVVIQETKSKSKTKETELEYLERLAIKSGLDPNNPRVHIALVNACRGDSNANG